MYDKVHSCNHELKLCTYSCGTEYIKYQRIILLLTHLIFPYKSYEVYYFKAVLLEAVSWQPESYKSPVHVYIYVFSPNW